MSSRDFAFDDALYNRGVTTNYVNCSWLRSFKASRSEKVTRFKQQLTKQEGENRNLLGMKENEIATL